METTLVDMSIYLFAASYQNNTSQGSQSEEDPNNTTVSDLLKKSPHDIETKFS